MISNFISKSEKETEKIAAKMAKKLRGGEVIALIGNLGTGKTVFIRGLARGLSIKKSITSPSFVLLKQYKIPKPKSQIRNKFKNQNSKFEIQYLIHIDAYRLKDEKDLIEIGILDWLGKKNTVTVIEWADKAKKILPKDAIKIILKIGKRENERIIQLDRNNKIC